MARLIVKSPYIKCGGGQSAGGYMKYIATRERVEIIPDDRPPTRKQEQLITKLVKDFPDTKNLLEYEDYAQHPTKANASSLITLALEENWSQVQSSEGYAKYIATRPRAERLGDHGLFGDEDGVELDKAMLELEHYTGNVWTHIISLHRKDAARLGYDNAQAWCALLRTHRNDIAAAMNIKPQDFRWYAAFHNEGEHPHVHMMAWSANPGQAYLSRDGIRQIKSALTNQIFKQEMLHLYEQKSESRDELVRETRKAMLELSRQMSESVCEHPEAERMILNLAQQLGEVKGKKSYGYAGTRTILLPSSTAQLLRERKKSALTEWIFPDPLCPERPVSPGSAYRRLKSLLGEAGLPDLRFHDLRHTFATHALTSGVDAKTLSGILGHTKASFTLDTYTHVTGDMQRGAAEIVGGFLTELLGEELEPWQRNENGEMAVST